MSKRGRGALSARARPDEEHGINAVPVVDRARKLVGIVTSRDTRFEKHTAQRVEGRL